MNMKLATTLGLLLLSTSAWAAAPAAPATDCDRECLRGLVTQVLHSFVDDNTAQLPVTANLRVTEDAVEKPLDRLELTRRVTKLRGYRQDVIDERTGQVVTGAMVEEGGVPVLLVVRVKADGARVSELELVATRSRADGMLFIVDGLQAPSLAMNIAPAPAQLATREKAVEIAMFYPRGLNSAVSFNSVGLPFSPDAYRLENGSLMAGPRCTFAPGCDNIGEQSLAIFKQLGRVSLRDIIVDERMGIVMMRISWNQRGGENSPKLTAWEMFKVYGGQMHMVEAYIRLFPPELEFGGWPVKVAQP